MVVSRGRYFHFKKLVVSSWSVGCQQEKRNDVQRVKCPQAKVNPDGESLSKPLTMAKVLGERAEGI